MKPTLLILAAGMGSRYGGLKQIEPVGPGGKRFWNTPFLTPSGLASERLFL
jgi:hypothetical protein